MVGEGVLHECLLHPQVEEVLVIGRKPCGYSHPKIKEIIMDDFFKISKHENELQGYDACFFCSGTSILRRTEGEYRKITYDMTLAVARILAARCPDMTFCYVSGAGTDSTENGKVLWARIKGKTENDLFRLPFKQVFAFRPGYIQPTKGLRHTLWFYKTCSWLYPVWRTLFPSFVSTLREVGVAMINATLYGYDRQILEVKDINTLAKIGNHHT